MASKYFSAQFVLLFAQLLSAQLLSAQTDSLEYSESAADTVLVTVGRIQEEMREIPLAITVVPKEVLQTRQGVGLNEVLTLVPGVVAQSRSGASDVRIQIRGFGARGAGQRSNAGTSRGVRFYQDGIPETEPDGRTSFDLLNTVHASRIEVVRSNASTLWGNASGGVVMLSSVPTSTKPLIQFSSTAGSFGLFQNAILANSPVGDGQVYLSLHNTSFDGWRTHSNSELTQGTIGLVLHPTSRSKVGVFAVAAKNEFRIPGALTLEQFTADPQQAQDDPNVYSPTYVERDESRNNTLGRIGATLDHSFNNEHGIMSTAFVQTKVLQRSERNTWRDFTRYHVGGNMVYRNTTVVHSDLILKGLAGVDLQYQDGAILFYDYDLATHGRGTTLRANRREGAMNLGAFIQAEAVTESFSAQIGVRLDAVTYYYQDNLSPSLNSQRTFQLPIPKLGFSYVLSKDVSIYANLGGGIEVPAGNETDPPAISGEDTVYAINPLLEPIRSTTFEVGLKGAKRFSGFVEQIQFDGAAYLIDVRNDIVPYRNGRFYMTAGHSQRIGAELGFTLRTAEHISLLGAFTIMKSDYRDYVVDSAFIDTAAAGKTIQYAGNAVPGIPTFSSTLRLRYDAPFFAGLFAETEWRVISGYYADDANTIQVDETQAVDLALGARFQIVDGVFAVDVSLRVNNVFNNVFMASAWINPDATSGGTPYIEPGLPRNISAGVKLSFTP